MSLLVYTYGPEWQLPSLSVASVQVEAYLRIAEADFRVYRCSTSSSSPTGQVPALENGRELVGTDANSGDEFDSARATFEYLRRNAHDIDGRLTPAEKAELIAFGALVQHHLEPATLYCTWIEDYSYSTYTRGAYSKSLPFPLSFFVPLSQRRSIRKRIVGRTRNQIYSAATVAYAAFAQRLESHGANFVMGDKPCSIDAMLFPHLLYHYKAPVSPPELRDSRQRPFRLSNCAYKITDQSSLVQYINRLYSMLFSTPTPEGIPLDRSAWDAAQSQDDTGGHTDSPAESTRRRNSILWLLGVGSLMTAYVRYLGVAVIASDSAEYDDEDYDDQ